MSERMLPTIEKLKELYLVKRLDCGEICRMYGLSDKSRSNLAIMLKKNGVEIRKQSGKDHHSWKGGRIIKGDGYYGIWNPTHERADSQGYVYEHTLVYEKNMGKLPQKYEVIHHINLDKLDNRFENLFICGNKEHLICHRSIEKLIKPLLEKGIIYFDKGEYKIK